MLGVSVKLLGTANGVCMSMETSEFMSALPSSGRRERSRREAVSKIVSAGDARGLQKFAQEVLSVFMEAATSEQKAEFVSRLVNNALFEHGVYAKLVEAHANAPRTSAPRRRCTCPCQQHHVPVRRSLLLSCTACDTGCPLE